jgi:hypothetical protein
VRQPALARAFPISLHTCVGVSAAIPPGEPDDMPRRGQLAVARRRAEGCRNEDVTDELIMLDAGDAAAAGIGMEELVADDCLQGRDVSFVG